MNCWYPVFCKPRAESIAENNLRNQDYETYFPRVSVRRRHRGIWVERIEPLFPRYLFLRLADRARSLAPVRSTIGVSDLVRVGGQPAVISNAAIEQLRAREDPEAGAYLWRREFIRGQRLKFVDGPFSGLEAIYETDAGNDRALVLLDLLGKTNRLQVDRDWMVELN